MKKIAIIVSILAATLVSFSSCQKDNIFESTQEEAPIYHSLTFTAGIGEDTKTTFNADKTAALWCEEDKANFLVLKHYTENGAAKTMKATNQEVTLSEGNRVATINATFEVLGSGCTLNGYQAIVAASKDDSGNPIVAAHQTPSADGYDKNADVLISQLLPAGADATNLKFNFKRVVCINKMTLKGLTAGDKVSTVTFTATAGLAPKYNIADNNSLINGSSSIECDLQNVEPDASGNLVVYFISGVGEFATPEVQVISDKALYSKTFTKNITFGANNYYSFGVNNLTRTPGAVYSHVSDMDSFEEYVTYVIANQNAPKPKSDAKEAKVMGARNGDRDNMLAEAILAKMNGGTSILVDESKALPLVIYKNDNDHYEIVTENSFGKTPQTYLARKTSNKSNRDLIPTTSYSDLAEWAIGFTNGYVNINCVNTDVSSFSIQFNNSSSLFSTYSTSQQAISLYKRSTGEVPTPPTPVTKYSITVNPATNGTISIAGNQTEAAEGETISLSALPANGYIFEAWDVKDARNKAITVTNNQFTMPASDVTVSATFSVIHEGGNTMSVDFESETSAYTDWTFTNITTKQTNSNVSAHSGSYFGTTDGKTTGSVQTKNKVASPGTISFYISKTSTNTTSSSWKIQISSNGTSWTDVTTVSASSVTRGEWTEVSRVLSSYSNVYVRVYYNGSTAVRCIDDLTLSSSTGSTTNYTVTIANDIANGTVIASPTSATEGATVTLTATPASGYELESWNVINASTSEAITVSSDNQFTMPAANVNVSATFKEKTALKTIDEIFAAATAAGATATETTVTFNNWVVSGVKGSNAYVTDGTEGFIIYGSGHGFEAGDVLSGTADCKVQLYNGSAELTALKTSTSGLTVSKGGTVTPVTTIALANLSGINTGAVLSYESLTYNGTDFTDGETTIKPYNTFITLPILISGKNYNVTGVYIQFKETKEIAPLKAEDFVLNEEVQEYPVSIINPENGTLVVKNGESVLSDGDLVEEGTLLSIECTPANSDYRFKNWGYKDGDAAWVGNMTTTFTHVMPSSPCSFKATFEPVPTYTIEWSVNGTIAKSETLKEGATVTAPDVEDINGKKFMGWVETSSVDAGVAPTFVTPSATATADMTYYAVFATQSGSGSESWNIVTDAGELEENDVIAIVSSEAVDYNIIGSTAQHNGYIALGKTQNTNNRAGVVVTVSDDVLTINEDVQQITLSKGSYNGNTDWQLGVDNGYIYACNSDKNYLKTQLTNNVNGLWNINIADGKATICAKYSTFTRNYLRVNGNHQNSTSASPLVSAYAENSTTGVLASIYKKISGTSYSDYCTTIPIN